MTDQTTPEPPTTDDRCPCGAPPVGAGYCSYDCYSEYDLGAPVEYAETPRPPAVDDADGLSGPDATQGRTGVPQTLSDGQESDSHWLKFNADRQVTGCQCGFRADIDSDYGWGDSVVNHLMEVGADAARPAHYRAAADSLRSLGADPAERVEATTEDPRETVAEYIGRTTREAATIPPPAEGTDPEPAEPTWRDVIRTMRAESVRLLPFGAADDHSWRLIDCYGNELGQIAHGTGYWGEEWNVAFTYEYGPAASMSAASLRPAEVLNLARLAGLITE